MWPPITQHQRTLACQPTVRSEGGREHTALKMCDVCDTGAWLELHEQVAWRAHALLYEQLRLVL